MEQAPDWIRALPPVNAALNAISGVLLVLGYRFIRGGRIAAHKTCMVGALGVSAAFLTSYLTLHYHVGATTFGHHGEPVRWLYMTILTSHTILAMVVAPMVLVTVYRALRERFSAHARIARWTLPIWLYVSVTGVIVYLMLYHFPGAEG